MAMPRCTLPSSVEMKFYFETYLKMRSYAFLLETLFVPYYPTPGRVYVFELYLLMITCKNVGKDVEMQILYVLANGMIFSS